MTDVLHTRAELAAAVGGTDRRAFVPTMGALHAGHVELIKRARELVGVDGQVVVSVFVNPLQFNQAADLAAYPVALGEDLALVAAAGGDVVWAPSVVDVYPPGEPVISPDPGPLGEDLEGASRPGHFVGVLTVVQRLLKWVQPQVAVFGEKDFQQLVLVRRLVAQLEFPCAIETIPIVRDRDGLALSSRNSRLSLTDRQRALAIPRALRAGAAAVGNAVDVVAAARSKLTGLDVDYVECRSVELDVAAAVGPARLLVAAVVGGVRLIDNAPVLLSEKS
jgi:pantoate--beta-alanine ligase